MITRRRCRPFPSSETSLALPSRVALPFKGRVGWGWCWVCCLAVVARTDSRPCVVCRPSMAASYFLLLAQKKVTKEKGTLGFAPLAERAVRYGRTGSAHRPSMACCPNRRDPSRRPRAGHAAGPSALRRYSEGTRRARAKERKKPTCRIYPVLLRQGLPRSALPGPLSAAASRWRKSRDSDRRQDAGEFDLSTGTCCGRTPEPAREVCRHGCRQTAAARVPFSLVTFFWASKRK